MAGVIAMASVIEDFEAQPCKKCKKDNDAPGVKTITNYFTPVAKTVEKPFSTPRSNNIKDYFKKTPPATNVVSPPHQSKENELHPVETLAGADYTAKRGKSHSKKSGRKVERQKKVINTPGTDEDVVVVESRAPSENQPAEATVPLEIAKDTGNTVSVIQDSNETVRDYESINESNCTAAVTTTLHKDKTLKESSTGGMPSLRTDLKQDGAGLPVSSTSEEKERRGRAVRETGRGEKTDSMQQCSEQQQLPSLPCHVSSEEEANEESPLNLSTVTVSFEEFLKSQSPKGAKQREEEMEEGRTWAGGAGLTPPPINQATDELSIDQPSKDRSNQPPAQVSPRTLTIQAEVHPISPDQDLSRASDRKVASIFTTFCRTKDKPMSSPQPQGNSESHALRKSNVVLQEDDLELAVLEAGSSATMPKCSQAERKQFMNAFKQPSLDPAKGKASRAAGKQKQQQLAEKAAPADGEEGGGNAMGPEVEMVEADPKPVELKSAAQKVAGKRKRGRPKKDQRASCEEPTPPAALPPEAQAPHPPLPPLAAAEDGDTQPSIDQPTITPVGTERRRRSARELACKQSTPASLTPSSRDAESSSKPQDLPGLVSTPRTHHPKQCVYRSHMVVPPDNKGSPIRMKFTRVFTSPGEISEFEILSPLAKEDSKKRKKAQRLVQKARAFQQSKQAAADEKAPLRRSSRHQDMVKKNYCEPEDTVICIEKGDTSPTVKAEDTKAKNQKQVRSLNDVLGKNTSGTKVTRLPSVTGSKTAPVFLGKKPQRSSAVISIFDDSSRDASDTSQDDEQFRARREFLKSGLPESFKKQIAKTAASREAYTLSCFSFQRVVHVLQRPEKWSLPWPACPRLSCLKEAGALVSRPPLAAVGPLSLCIVPAQRSIRGPHMSGWREDLSEPVQRWLLQEISAANPSFPTQRLFTQLLKRRAEHLLKPTALDTDGVPQEAAGSSFSQPVGGKRKREEKEGGAAEMVAKKQRSSRKELETIVLDGAPEPPRRGRGVRGRTRSQQQQEEAEREEPKAEVLSTPVVSQKDAVIVLDSPSPVLEHTSTEDVAREDVMWTEKYQPQQSSDVIGNIQSVRRLHSWLREWKQRADHEERKKQQEKKQEEDCNDSWLSECGDGLEEDLLCNTLLITGPTGVGKTAAVYACAQELGFKVFEVNCSSQRSGRQILSQLKEATQSHQVDIQGVNAHKPTFFNSSSSSGSGSRLGSSPRKVSSPRRVVSSPHKPPQSPRQGPSKRGSLAPTSLTNFFKMGGRPPKEPAEMCSKKSQPASKSPHKKITTKETPCKSAEGSATPVPAVSTPAVTPATGVKAPGDEQSKRTATSLILFEEVDVIFDDDSGFLAAIKTFMTTTKRPVILTTSDPTFRTTFDGCFDEIHFETPSVESVSSYLRLLCLAENVRAEAADMAGLLSCTSGDVRRSLLQLQCWIRSGGGAPHRDLPTHTASGTQSLQDSGRGSAVDKDGKLDVPLCDALCTASSLGLLNIQPQGNLLEFIKCQSASPLCWELLAEAGRRGLDLLYSNMEVLLPLPTCTLQHAIPIANREPWPGQTAPTTTFPPPQSAVPNTNTKLHLLAETEDEASPLKVSSRMRQKKQLHSDAKDHFQSDSDSDDGLLLLPRPTTAPSPAPEQLKEEQPPARPAMERWKKVELTEAERKRSVPVSLALGAIAEFLEDMSALDSSLPCPAAEDACRPLEAYGWAQAKIRSGLTDEPRQEGGRGNCSRWAAEEQAQDIRAAAESLSFGRCRSRAEQAWGAAQALDEEEVRRAALEEITLPVAPHRLAFSITPDSTLCHPGSLQRKCEVMRNTCSSRAGTSSRMATALDVLPALRTICRSEQLKEQGKIKRRFLHYLESINLGFSKQTLQLLATDFP